MRIAIIIAGCGRGDGTEVTEAVSTLVHVSRHGAGFQCFAPDQSQADVINHATGTPMGESRNLLVEAARISRGDIRDIASLRAEDFDAVIFPGGFGAAKNLCDFASKGPACNVHPQVVRVLQGFHQARKPIGLICIAPMLGAKVFGKAAGGPGCDVTIGMEPGPAQAVAAMGATNVPMPTTRAHVDRARRIVTTPAYMDDKATPFEVFTGIGRLVDEVVALAGAPDAPLPTTRSREPHKTMLA